MTDPNLVTGRRPGRTILIWIVASVIFAAAIAFVYNRSKTAQREMINAPAQIERGNVSPATGPTALPSAPAAPPPVPAR